ncbi:amine oxidase catalytic domain-containing protein [Thozetella sp. PMI_491]|nr:amine oxidase catalytic domain-containing protein [Thozetella sp. PMI_491]
MERSRRPAALALFAIVFVALLSLWTFISGSNGGQNPLKLSRPAQNGRKSSFKAPRRNLWADLDQHDASEIYGFLLKEWADLNLTKNPASTADNYIYTVELLRPNKTDATSYLHRDQAEPGRYAKVSLAHTVEGESRMSYYTVGPLPVSVATQVTPLVFPYSSGRNYVKATMMDFVAYQEFGLSLLESISDITTELLGAKVDRDHPGSINSLTALGRMDRTSEGGVSIWTQLFRPGMGSSGRTLLPQGIYYKINATGSADQWSVSNWYYNGVLYDSVEDFRVAIKSSSFRRTPPNLDGPWTDTEDFDSDPDGRELPPPITVQPYGPRYKLDREEKYVSWFGFEFYFASTQATGISIHDVRFKGESVMYELSLQEALAHYAGDDPMAGGQQFLDAFFGMGVNAFELVPGYDCPAYADFISSEVHRLGQTEKRPNNICLFEFTSESLLSRHSAQFSVTVSKNTFLTLRSVSTVGNYDYTVDYIFYLDGTIEVKVRASGYIYAAFYANHTDKTENEYGHRIHEALSSSLHDHVISFKADLDVAGTSNDLVRIAVEPTTVSYNWDQPQNKQRNTMHLKEYPVDVETGLDWPRNSGEFYIVYSSDATNSWGQRKGYRVVSGTGMGNTPHLTILNSTALGSSARWAEKDVWVVRQKDTEPRGADPMNWLVPGSPLVDFAAIANGESLGHGTADADYDGDLVLYVNVGSHHLPHSGDLPNTLMHTSASSVMFVPHNFADRDPSRESVQGVRVQLKGTNSGGFPGIDPDPQEPDDESLRARSEKHYQIHQGANYFGAPYTKGLTLPLADLEPDLAKKYNTAEMQVTDLSVNGSAAGMWLEEP